MQKNEQQESAPQFPPDALLRLWQVLLLIPISKSSWYAGIKAGIYPPPEKLGPKTSVWPYRKIRPILERGTEQ